LAARAVVLAAKHYQLPGAVVPEGNMACPSEVTRAENGAGVSSWGCDVPFKLKAALLGAEEANTFVVLAAHKSSNINNILKTSLQKRASFTDKEYQPRPLWISCSLNIVKVALMPCIFTVVNVQQSSQELLLFLLTFNLFQTLFLH
jgi:hypothetical protein